MKIGITGSKLYTKKSKIKELIWMIKNNNDENIIVVSLGGKYGADKFIRKYSIEFGLKYFEFLPRHNKWNSYCAEKPYLFNQEYSPKWFFISESNFVKNCDRFIYFTDENDKLNENKLIELIKKSSKQLIIVE